MGTYTLANFTDSLTFELGQRSDVSTYVANWINQAYIDFTTRNKFWQLRFPKNFRFPELDTDQPDVTIDGTAYVATPTDCLYPHTVHDDTNDKKLDNMVWRTYIKKTGRATATSEGKPAKWVRYGSRIYFHPTPDAAYTVTIYYRKIPAVMITGQTTAIQSIWDEPILKLAVIQSLMRLKEYDKATKEKAEWIDMMAGKLGVYDYEALDRNEFFAPDIQDIDYSY